MGISFDGHLEVIIFCRIDSFMDICKSGGYVSEAKVKQYEIECRGSNVRSLCL